MRQLLVVALLTTIISCVDNKRITESIETDSLTIEQIDSVLNKFQFEYENPIILDSSDYLLIPISTELFKSRKSYSKDGYYTDEFPRYWNVLFYNVNNGDVNLLTEDKFRISEINAKKERGYQDNRLNTLPNKILYIIGDRDYNKDGKLDYSDPNFLFISEQDGSNLLRLSPPNENLVSYEVIPNSYQIIINTLRDTNQDSIFNRIDQSMWYEVELINNEWVTQEII
ncbi:MAG: hypothetical protein AAFN93_18960, partial [Bacteroidota bacterium]